MAASKKPAPPAIKAQNMGAFIREAQKESGNPLLTPRRFSWEGAK